MDHEPEEPDWLTDMDKEILGILTTELILTPSIIAENIGRSRKGVSNRITSLQAGGLVTKVDRGKYRITDEGLSVWEIADTRGARTRHMEVIDRTMIRKEFGVTKEEYHEEIMKEREKIKEEGKDFEKPWQEAVNRAEERLRTEHEEEVED